MTGGFVIPAKNLSTPRLLLLPPLAIEAHTVIYAEHSIPQTHPTMATNVLTSTPVYHNHLLHQHLEKTLNGTNTEPSKSPRNLKD